MTRLQPHPVARVGIVEEGRERRGDAPVKADRVERAPLPRRKGRLDRRVEHSPRRRAVGVAADPRAVRERERVPVLERTSWGRGSSSAGRWPRGGRVVKTSARAPLTGGHRGGGSLSRFSRKRGDVRASRATRVVIAPLDGVIGGGRPRGGRAARARPARAPTRRSVATIMTNRPGAGTCVTADSSAEETS